VKSIYICAARYEEREMFYTVQNCRQGRVYIYIYVQQDMRRETDVLYSTEEQARSTREERRFWREQQRIFSLSPHI
jgi:hypothetical protein